MKLSTIVLNDLQKKNVNGESGNKKHGDASRSDWYDPHLLSGIPLRAGIDCHYWRLGD